VQCVDGHHFPLGAPCIEEGSLITNSLLLLNAQQSPFSNKLMYLYDHV
jgi:hypothetical protein